MQCPRPCHDSDRSHFGSIWSDTCTQTHKNVRHSLDPGNQNGVPCMPAKILMGSQVTWGKCNLQGVATQLFSGSAMSTPDLCLVEVRFQIHGMSKVQNRLPNSMKVLLLLKKNTPVIHKSLKSKTRHSSMQPQVKNPVDYDHPKHRQRTALRESTVRAHRNASGIPHLKMPRLPSYKGSPCFQDPLGKTQLNQSTP